MEKSLGSKRPQLVKIESSKAYSEHKKLKSKREQLVRIQIQIQSSRSTKDYGRKHNTILDNSRKPNGSIISTLNKL